MPCRCHAWRRYSILIISLSRLFRTLQLFASAFPARQCLSAPMHPPHGESVAACRKSPRCDARRCNPTPMPCPARLICADTVLRVPVIALPLAIHSFSYPSNPLAFRIHARPLPRLCIVSFPSHCFALPFLHISGRACPINSRALRCSASPMPSSSNRSHVSSMLCRLIAQQVRGDHSSRTSLTLTAPSICNCFRIRTGPLWRVGVLSASSTSYASINS